MSVSNTPRVRPATFGIQTKLAFLVGAIVVFAVAVGFLGQYKQRVSSLKSTQEEIAELMSGAVAGQISDLVTAGDSAALQAVLKVGLPRYPDIHAVSIYGASKEELVTVFADDAAVSTLTPLLKTFQSKLTENSASTLERTSDYALHGTALTGLAGAKTAGTIVFAWDMAPIFAKALREQLMAAVASFIAGSLAMALLIWLVGRLAIKPMLAISEAMDKVANHDFDTEIPNQDRGDEVGAMAQRLAVFRDRLAEEEHLRSAREKVDAQQHEIYRALAAGLSDLADGRVDRTVDTGQFDGGDQDQIAILNDFNQVVTNLRNILTTATSTAENVRNSSQEIAEVVIDQSKRSEAQAVTLEESAAAIETLSTSVENTAERAADANKRILENREQAQAGGNVVDQTVDAMKNIEASSEQIRAIIGVIDDIAFQTNLLALNAGVEAARAGEAGRGFAVVASEVRALAQRASSSANEIKELITRSGEQVTNGSRLVHEAGSALHDIIDGINHASELVSQIATGSRDQANNLIEIKENVTELDRVTQRNAAMIEESSAASRTLSEEAGRLTQTLASFTLNGIESEAAIQSWDEDLAADSPAEAVDSHDTWGAADTVATDFSPVDEPQASEQEPAIGEVDLFEEPPEEEIQTKPAQPTLEFASRNSRSQVAYDTDSWSDF
ncbi:Methyl-accepting chemotaxis protein I [Shimia sp. SK013]|uniref:methyl-accepting chemotaxis protein n=1 Tax=Shimia sp. SK013 TaxID=1389006 RepID=UPI0006B56DC9|nr:methyl-accepting chemotaxis protein [Shimia sp. SK013]KPA20857.1 Methyl-accepting chemotaxis protein I [Shimia sp. SK013]